MTSVAVKARSHYAKLTEICDVILKYNNDKSSYVSSLKYNNLIWIKFHKDSFFNHCLYADVQLFDCMERLYV